MSTLWPGGFFRISVRQPRLRASGKHKCEIQGADQQGLKHGLAVHQDIAALAGVS